MRLLIIDNNKNWTTWPGKIQAVKDFFLPKVPFHVDLVQSNFQYVPLVVSRDHAPLYVVDDTWYDTFITSQATGYDLVMFCVSEEDKKGRVTVFGIDTGKRNGTERLQLFTNENDRAYINSIDQGNTTVLYICHEISHALYSVFNKEDRTHEFFYKGNPAGILQDFPDQNTLKNTLIDLYRQVISLLFQKKMLLENEINEIKKSNRELLYEAAKASLGKAIAPTEISELGCAIAVNKIHEKAFGTQIGGDTSTYRLYLALKDSPLFNEVKEPLFGDVVVSPTGFGNGTLPHGHAGYVAKHGILSNDSISGLFEQNYTMESWKFKYVTQGGFPMRFFRRK